ncbi:NAD(P)(+) transhydrogenase (Re/Si-specific) subunit beta [Mycobacterium sp.]|uniref:NAD(P)(+) transhydrogenase (Re/Si-specific) subunit beta n=1 Tax=Mycobacterium sp. TaxID=1785 RepID=UPI003F9C60B5
MVPGCRLHRCRRLQLSYAGKVVIVPGYGLAAAQAQHEVVELAAALTEHGVDRGSLLSRRRPSDLVLWPCAGSGRRIKMT